MGHSVRDFKTTLHRQSSLVSKSINLTNSKAVKTITRCDLSFDSLHISSLNCSPPLSMSLRSYHSVVDWIVSKPSLPRHCTNYLMIQADVPQL